MAARPWKCQMPGCGALNDPTDQFRQAGPNTCASCGRWRYLLHAIGAGGAILVVMIVVGVVWLLKMPERTYRETYSQYLPGGISADERDKLKKLAERFDLDPQKIQKIETEFPGSPAQPANPPIQPPIPGSPPPLSPPPPPDKQPSLEAMQHMHNGVTHASSGDYANAIKEFDLAIELYPSYAAAYSNRGVAYKQLKKLNKAEEDLTKAVKLDPKDKNAHYNLACLYCLRDKEDLALGELDKSLGLGFDNYDLLRSDSNLDKCRKDPEFRKSLENHKIFIMK